MAMKIGILADAAGVNVPTVRYYERRGIIAKPARTPSGYRLYDEGVVSQIRFIKRAQDLGFSLGEIESLLDLRIQDPGSCAPVARTAAAKLRRVEGRIHELQRLRTALAGLVRSCNEKRPTDECPVLAMLDGEPQ